VGLIAGCWLAGRGVPVDGLDRHCLRQTPDTFPVDLIALAVQRRGYLARPVEWCGQVLAVDHYDKGQVLFRDPYRLVVGGRAADVQQLALAHHRERRISAVDQGAPPLCTQRPKAFSKKSGRP
jgi:hypothetical protein